jgi:hypothetical protein
MQQFARLDCRDSHQQENLRRSFSDRRLARSVWGELSRNSKTLLRTIIRESPFSYASAALAMTLFARRLVLLFVRCIGNKMLENELDLLIQRPMFTLCKLDELFLEPPPKSE